MSEPECTPQLGGVNIGWKIQVTVLTTWIPVLLAVAARVAIRRRNRSILGADDYLMMIALVPISLGSIFHLIAVSYGLGRHTYCLPLEQLSHSIKWQYLGEGMNILSIWVVKLSICFFLLRLIEGVHRKARIVIWTLIILNTTLQVVGFTVCWGAAKTPIWSWWDFDVKPNSVLSGCFTYDQVVFIVNVVIDFVFAFSPIFFLWDIRIPKQQRYTLWGLMLLAILPSIAGVLKVAYLGEVVHATEPTYSPLRIDDIAALVEQNGGTFVANLPSLKVLFTYVATAASQSYTDLLSRTFSRGTARGSSSDIAGNRSEDISLDRDSVRKKPISNILTHDPGSLEN